MKMLLTVLALSIFFVPVFASYSDVQADRKGRTNKYETTPYELWPDTFNPRYP